MNKKLFTLLALIGFSCIIAVVPCFGQSDFKMVVNPVYTVAEKITDEIYRASTDYPADPKVRNSLSPNKLVAYHWVILDYKGNQLVNESFNSCAALRKSGLIVCSKNKRIVGLYNYLTKQYSTVNFDQMGMADGKLVFYTAATNTYSLYDRSGNYLKAIKFNPGYTIKESLSGYAGDGFRSDDYLNNGDFYVVERQDGVDTRYVVNGANPPKYLYGIFDVQNENWVLPPNYQEISDINSKLLRVIPKDATDDHSVYIDWSGNVKLNPGNYQTLHDFGDGLAAVQDQNDKWGFINMTGTVQIPAQFDAVSESESGDFKNGFCVVGYYNRSKPKTQSIYKYEVKWGLIKSDGSKVLDYKYKSISPIDNLDNVKDDDIEDYTFSNFLNAYLFTFENFDGTYGVATSDGNVLIDQAKTVYFTHESVLAEMSDKKLTVIKLQDRSQVNFTFDELLQVEKGLIVYNKNGVTNIDNLKGGSVFKSRFSRVFTPYLNYLWVQENGLLGIAYSENLTTPQVSWQTPVEENTKLNENQVSVKATVKSYTHLAKVSVMVGDQTYPITDRTKSLTRGNPVDEITIDRVFPVPNSSQAIPLRISAENELGNIVSQKSISVNGPANQGTSNGRRLAIIIGNEKYRSQATLEGCLNDMNDMAAALKTCGFEILKDSDLTVVNFPQKMSAYKSLSSNYGEIVFYFSGHGASIGSLQYLVPVDVSLKGVEDIKSQCISTDNVMALKTRADQSLVIVTDACRDLNTAWQDQALRQEDIVKDLLHAKDPAQNVCIWYGTLNGTTAAAGLSGRKNSLFTSYLLKSITQPYDIERLAKIVNQNMVAQNEPQYSYFKGNLLNFFQFKY
ncbi:MAG: peptidase caspase catalytic subunit p20 [Mucilaginibacter sp.]|nr:peptidase caspase catalytic subunit p20 [Mucilaginibacter sp.]